MDRGVKVAIFVASVVSLGLGLVWDQVLNQARTSVAQTASADELGPETMNALMGSPEIRRLEVPQNFEVNEPEAESGDTTAAPITPTEPTRVPPVTHEYVVQQRDTWSGIVQDHFYIEGISNSERVRMLAEYNGISLDVPLREGTKIIIPSSLDAIRSGQPVRVAGYSPPTGTNSQPTPGASYIEYTIKSGDNWTLIVQEMYRIEGISNSQRVRMLAEFNGMDVQVPLRVGDVIRIPVNSR
jgi:nucleoid-associated protein YgaU